MKNASQTKLLQGGSVLKTITFEFRAIDEYGDSIDPQHCDTLTEAMAMSQVAIGDGECVAWVIERHTAYYPSRFGEEKYQMIASGGSREALHEGGWKLVAA
jgi:hypothetical protein